MKIHFEDDVDQVIVSSEFDVEYGTVKALAIWFDTSSVRYCVVYTDKRLFDRYGGWKLAFSDLEFNKCLDFFGEMADDMKKTEWEDKMKARALAEQNQEG